MEKIIKEMVTMKSSSANMARLSVAAVAVSGLVALGCMRSEEPSCRERV